MPSACLITSAEFCRALSFWRANKSPQCPAQGQLRAAAQKILFNPDGPEVWDVDGRNLPLDTQQGEGRWPWQRAFSDSYLLPSLWPQAPEKGGQLQGPRRNPPLPGAWLRPMLGLGNHQGLMDRSWGKGPVHRTGSGVCPLQARAPGRTALKHSTLPPSTPSLSKASFPIFLAPLFSSSPQSPPAGSLPTPAFLPDFATY